MTPIDRELQETLGALVILRAPAEKVALFRALGTGADWILGKGFRALKPAAKLTGRGASRGVRKGYDVLMEAGGIKGITKEQKLLSLMRARNGTGAAWDTVRDLAKARGLKSPATVMGTLFSPISTLTGRTTESGYARWLLSELKDPAKLQQFLRGATPDEVAAAQKLTPYFAQAHRAGSISKAGTIAPVALMGGPVAYNLATGMDPAQRPVVTSPHRGIAPKPDEDQGMFSGFWGSKGTP
jgi:hypothetical protein